MSGAVDPAGGPGHDRPASPGRPAARALRDRPAAPALALARGLGHPVTLMFLLAGIFDLLSRGPVVHWGTLLAVSAALAYDVARDAQGGRPGRAPGGTGTRPAGSPGVGLAPAPPAPGWRLTPALILGGALYALVAGAFARYTWPATVAVACPAAAGIAIAWRVPVREAARSARIGPLGLAAWAAVFVAAGVWELIALLLQPSLDSSTDAHPTISALADPLLASHPGRSVALALWLASGWFLLRR